MNRQRRFELRAMKQRAAEVNRLCVEYKRELAVEYDGWAREAEDPAAPPPRQSRRR